MWKTLDLRPVRRDGGIYEQERRVWVCRRSERHGKENVKGIKEMREEKVGERRIIL